MKGSIWKRRLSAAESKISELLERLTLEEKVSLCHAGGKFCNNGVSRLGLPPLVMSDGPHGVRQELAMHGWDMVKTETDTTTYLPVGTVMAATWNPALGSAFGEVLGSESRARGKDVILGPGFNIIRDPLCGRNFEYFSEDPCLISKLIPSIVQGIQNQDTAACAKHFALNNQELNRHGYSADPEERALREIYLPGFEAAVKEGETLTVMGAYNQYKGQWCCHNKELLVDILKEQWGFMGIVISDWDGCHVSDEAATNGLDVEMGTTAPSYSDFHLANAFLEGLKAGQFSEELLNDKVRRILRVIYALGLLSDDRKPGKQHPPEHCAIGRAIAEEGAVLLKNDGRLPLKIDRLKKIAVIGDNATCLHASGGGSSGVKAFYEITPLEGLRERLGEQVKILYSKGYPEETLALPQIPDHYLATVDEGSGIKGWRVEWNNFHQFEGETLTVEFREQVSLSCEASEVGIDRLNESWWATRWTAELTAPKSGSYTFALNSKFSARLYVDNVELIGMERNKACVLHTAEIELEAGCRYALRVEYGHSSGKAYLDFGWFLPGERMPERGEALAAALALAKEADAVIFCGGLNHFHDTEGMDRKTYQLPGGQDRLIEALAAVNDEVHVVLVGGSAHAMPWADQVVSILLGGYAGMDAGRVFADVLTGAVNPSGKLPYTIAKKLEDYPAHQLNDYNAQRVCYREGVLVGYRWFDMRGIEPLFPFGHGLSYAQFDLCDLELSEVAGGVVALDVTVRNLGSRSGKEVVQIYLGDVESSVVRPPKELKAFEKVALEAGAESRLRFVLNERDFSFWDDQQHCWRLEPGEFVIHVGTSSRDLLLKKTFTI